MLAQAGDQVRRERAVKLGLDPRAGAQALLAQLQRRASDGAQTRPEWGLAGNAAFLIAPRQRSRHAVLDGRSFLHDYDATNDADGSVLELLMTAPMLVTHWINWQYHASTCDPQHLGSGNKLLHNVVGGDIGVFEGNGGDLRIETQPGRGFRLHIALPVNEAIPGLAPHPLPQPEPTPELSSGGTP